MLSGEKTASDLCRVYKLNSNVLTRSFHRFKRGQLPALPMFLQDQQRIVGLMFLLNVALPLLTLMEFVVHQQLQTLQMALEGIYAGNPKQNTERPQLLSAFCEITLYFLKDETVEYRLLFPCSNEFWRSCGCRCLSINSLARLNNSNAIPKNERIDSKK